MTILRDKMNVSSEAIWQQAASLLDGQLVRKYRSAERCSSSSIMPLPSRGASELPSSTVQDHLDPRKSAMNGIAIDSAVFAQHTDSQRTLRATSVPIVRIYAVRAGDAD